MIAPLAFSALPFARKLLAPTAFVDRRVQLLLLLWRHCIVHGEVYPALRAYKGGSVAEWLSCSTQAQKGPGSIRSRDAVG